MKTAARAQRFSVGSSASPEPFGAVPPAWVERRLGGPTLRVLDVRTEVGSSDASGTRLRAPRSGPSALYLAGHVPGAVALDVRAVLFDDDGEVVSGPELALAMSRLGVGDGHTVVLVDGGRPDAALAAAWALTRFGHRDVHILEGGFARWVGEGRAVSRDVVRHAPASYTVRVPT
jgi:thiosulfate/3-mercaptopyruvate sulfurtransferase